MLKSLVFFTYFEIQVNVADRVPYFCGLEKCEVKPQMCGEYAGRNSRMLLINILKVRQLAHHIKTGKGSETGQKFGVWLGFGWPQVTGGDLRI